MNLIISVALCFITQKDPLKISIFFGSFYLLNTCTFSTDRFVYYLKKTGYVVKKKKREGYGKFSDKIWHSKLYIYLCLFLTLKKNLKAVP